MKDGVIYTLDDMNLMIEYHSKKIKFDGIHIS